LLAAHPPSLRHGRRLAAEGRYEQATELLLCAGALDEAAASADHVIVAVVERLDLALAERWLKAFEVSSLRDVPSFVTAELMLALARDDPRRGLAVAERLRGRGRLERLVSSSASAAALLAWCHVESGVPVVADGLVASLWSDVGETEMPSVPAPTGQPLDAVVSAACYLLGRLSALDIPSSPWHEAVTAPWRVASLRASGRTQRALELLEAASATGTATVTVEASVRADLLIDAGRPDAARAAIAGRRQWACGAGNVAEAWRAELAAARTALRVDRDPVAARTVLDQLAAEIPKTGLYRELLDMWYGLALLLQHRDGAALARLRATVDRMLTGDRILGLPTAAVYLAEAEWRAHEEDAADRAADVALDAARRQGSNHLLLQALADFPSVVSRRIDAEPTPDSPWSALGRALIAQRAVRRRPVRSSVRLQEFGRSAMLVDDDEVRPRIAKTYELLAYLLLCPGAEASRHQLLNALFDGRADASTRAYLRQAILDLRRLRPHDTERLDDGRVRLAETVAGSDAIDFEAQLVEAARLQGTERLDATLAALELHDRGEYLAGAVSQWVLARRRSLTELATDARCEAAWLAFAAHRDAVAEQLTSRVLSDDPLREAAWRLAMRLARARGDDRGVTEAYHGCTLALSQIGTSPAVSTRRLAEELRRGDLPTAQTDPRPQRRSSLAW
jgi:DNA-binding SARP family transcriptional activator